MSLTKVCCICRAPITKEDAPVIAMSAYGNPKCVCGKCEDLIDKATLSHEPEEIANACNTLGEALTRGNTCDEQVIDAVNEIIYNATERGAAIEDGTYDFALDEAKNEPEFEITEDLMETELDRQLDEIDRKTYKTIDTILSWTAGIILVGAITFFIIKFVL